MWLDLTGDLKTAVRITLLNPGTSSLIVFTLAIAIAAATIGFTFADFALFAIATDVLNGDHAVTLNLSGDFLGSVACGALVEARGEVTRGGGKTIFVRGLVTGDGQPGLSFSGIIRRLARR